MQLPEIAALIELSSLPAGAHQPDIRVCLQFLFRYLGASQSSNRGVIADVLPAAAAVTVLQLFPQIPSSVALPDVAAALAPAGLSGFHAEQLVLLDSLLGLTCLLCSGDTACKLQLCYWALDRDGSRSLTQQQLLSCLPALQLTAAAARLILGQATRQSLATEQASATWQAAAHQRWQLMAAVLQQAFAEADTRGNGILRPQGEQVRSMLFSVAAQLTGIMMGATPAGPSVCVGSNSASSTSRRGEGVGFQMSPAAAGAAAVLAPIHSTHHGQNHQQQQHIRDAAAAGVSVAGSSRHDQAAAAAALQGEEEGFDSDGSSSSTSSGSRGNDEQHNTLQQQQQPGNGSTAFAVAAGSGFSQQQQQQQQAAARRSGSGAVADVVIVDAEGSMLHYQTQVAEAAAAAVEGRPPPSLPGTGMHLYQRNTRETAPSPAVSLSQQLELVEAAQQQQHNSGIDGASQPLSPVGSLPISSEKPANAGSSGGSTPSSLLSNLTAGISRRKLAAAGAPDNLVKRPAQLVLPEQLPSPAEAAEGGAAAAAIGAVAAGGHRPQLGPAITTTAGNVAATVQRNIALASARVLVHCSVCFLLVTMVLLADIALVAALHLAAGMPLAMACAIAVGVNGAIMLVLVSVLLLVRAVNNANSRSLVEVANGPQAQQLDHLLATISAAVVALKDAEQQEQQQQQQVLLPIATYTPSGATLQTTGYSPDGAAPAAGAGSSADGSGAPQLPFANKLRSVWSAVGRMAGFFPPPSHNGGLGREQDSGSMVGMRASSTMGAGLLSLTGGTAGARSSSGGGVPGTYGMMSSAGGYGGHVYHQSRSVRVVGTAASAAAARAGMSLAPPVAVSDAYPHL